MRLPRSIHGRMLALSLAMMLAYFRWGRWREATMLPVEPDAVAIPSEVPSQAPAPVADAGPRLEVAEDGAPVVALPR